MKLVLVGATGAVGTEMMRILEQREMSIDEFIPVASPRSIGRRLPFRGGDVEVQGLTPEVFEGADLALFDVADELAEEWAPIAAERGATVVDNSAAFRMADDVPLVVPEVNPEAAKRPPRGIIASPNCTTLAMVVPINALHEEFGVTRMIISSYQAASGSGQPGIEELWDQTQRAAKEPDAVRSGRAGTVLEGGETFVHPLALNFVPKCGSLKNDGYTSEELKLCYETRKIMSLPDLPVTATCVRVPVVTGHGTAVHAEFESELTPETARAVLESAPGVVVRDDPDSNVYPTALDAAGTDPCYVGRIRRDLFNDRALELFCVADNLRKGAALNTVQVAELVV